VPDAGSDSRSSKLPVLRRGIFQSEFLTSPYIPFDFIGESPHGLMIPRISSAVIFIMSYGLSARRRRGGGHFIDAFIRALSGEQYGNQQRVLHLCDEAALLPRENISRGFLKYRQSFLIWSWRHNHGYNTYRARLVL